MRRGGNQGSGSRHRAGPCLAAPLCCEDHAGPFEWSAGQMGASPDAVQVLRCTPAAHQASRCRRQEHTLAPSVTTAAIHPCPCRRKPQPSRTRRPSLPCRPALPGPNRFPPLLPPLPAPAVVRGPLLPAVAALHSWLALAPALVSFGTSAAPARLPRSVCAAWAGARTRASAPPPWRTPSAASAAPPCRPPPASAEVPCRSTAAQHSTAATDTCTQEVLPACPAVA